MAQKVFETYARQRMGPKLMNCCKAEQMGTKDYGNMMKRIQTLEDGRVPAKKAKTLEEFREKRKEPRERSIRELVNKFEMEGFMAPKNACGILRRKRSRGERG